MERQYGRWIMMWKFSLIKVSKWFLAIIAIAALFRILGLYMALDLEALRVMPKQMQSPLMLWRLIPPAILLLLLAHTPPGRTKPGRVIIGIYSVVVIYLHALYFVWSVIGPTVYYPTQKMNLDWLAGTGYVEQASHLFIVLPPLLLLGIFGFVFYHIYKEPKFWDQLFYGSINIPWLSENESTKKRVERTDVLICVNKESKKGVIWKEGDQPMNLGIIGPVGSGKTSRALLPILAQFILNLRVGIFVIEPKGDLVERLDKLARMTGRRVVYVDPANPESPVFNPLHGDDIDKIAEDNAMTMRSTFGNQEAYFANMQELAIKQMIKLLKYTKGNDCTYRDVNNYLINEKLVTAALIELDKLIPNKNDIDDPKVELRDWFAIEYLGNDKMKEAVNGLRGHMQNMVGNRYFRRVTCGRSEVDMETGIRNGDIFLFSTADGVLGESLSQTLGALILQHYQAALLTRGIIPPAGPERDQYKLSILCADEFGGYVNEGFGSFISKSRGYGGINILAMQTINQLKKVGRGNNEAFQQEVLGQLRSMIIFGGLGIVRSDAEYFSKNFGTEDQEVVTKRTGMSRGSTSFFFPDSVQEGEGSTMKEMAIHRATDIRYMPKGVVMYQIMQDQSLQKADYGLMSYFDTKEKHMGSSYWFMSPEFAKRAEALRKQLEEQNGDSMDRSIPTSFKDRMMRRLTKAGLTLGENQHSEQPQVQVPSRDDSEEDVTPAVDNHPRVTPIPKITPRVVVNSEIQSKQNMPSGIPLRTVANSDEPIPLPKESLPSTPKNVVKEPEHAPRRNLHDAFFETETTAEPEKRAVQKQEESESQDDTDPIFG